jgi:hypothetical protein
MALLWRDQLMILTPWISHGGHAPQSHPVMTAGGFNGLD